MEWLLELDQNLFLAVNGWHSTWMDEVMWVISNKYVWIPVYAMMLYGLYKQLGWPSVVTAVLMVVPLILMADMVSASLLKPGLERLRPCHDPTLQGLVHVVDGKCGGPYGFVSSHAANFFALATYLGFLFRQKWRGWPLIFFLFACLVGYSRIYLGVHYPGDVLGGALLGTVCGLIVIFLYRKVTPLLNFPHSERQ